MFKHILVPTDFSEESQKALEIATQMALDKAGRITLLHVIETIQGEESGEFAPFYEKLKKRAETKLKAMLEPYADTLLPMEKEILVGRRVPEILHYSQDNNVDLIVLSSHKIDPHDETRGLGTISYKVAILAPCPVMVVK
jgi:nucleotide-binding universal stress UspA family protein